MRKGTVRIPNEAFDRTVEYLDGSPGMNVLKFKIHAYLKFHNLVSHLYRAYHFDSVNEFLECRDLLQEKVSRVAFQELEVRDINDKGNILELALADNTGEVMLVYPYTLKGPGNYERLFPDRTNNPLHGAIKGDGLQVFDSIYEGGNKIFIRTEWHVKNDDHYGRMREIRDSVL